MKKCIVLMLVLALLGSSAMAESVSLTGSGTAIQSGVVVAQAPARVTVTGTVKLTLTGGSYDYTYNDSADASDVGVLTEAATFDALVEGKGDWSIAIEPIKEGGAVSCSGEGPYVSDFFPLDKATIITVTADPSAMDALLTNVILDLRYQSSFGLWLSDNLTNELLTKDKSFSADVIAKPESNATGFFWTLRVSPGVKWSVTAK